MKRLYLVLLTLCAALLSFTEAKAEIGQGVIKIKTDKGVGKVISMDISVFGGIDSEGDDIDLDPKDGENISFEGATKYLMVNQKVYLTVNAPEITIHGDVNSLTIVNQEVTDIDLSGANKLTHLRVNENPLTTLDLSHNANLIELWATSCSALNTIKFANAASLMTLSIQGTTISSLDFSQLPSLRTLHAGDNPNLTSIDLSTLTELDELWVNGNGITSIDLSHNPNLAYLECSRNKLTTLDLTNNPELNFVACWCNQISGEGMNSLIQSLVLESEGEERELCVFNEFFTEEKNALTDAQITAVKARGWTPKKAKGTKDFFTWEELTKATTGINATSAATKERETWYDLQGRRIEKPTVKGLYIHNGKKILLK